MSIITLTTDWGTRDHYAGALKGMLHSVIPGINIVDISHFVAHNNIQQAAYIFKNAFEQFPAGTIHFIGVNTTFQVGNELLAIKKNGQYFIGANNGLFSMIFEDMPVDMVILNPIGNPDLLFDIATITGATKHLAEGKNIYELGSRPSNFVTRSSFLPVIEEDVLRGIIIYIDDFGNVITNIDQQLFEQQRKERKFEIVTRRSSNYSIDKISKTYNEVEAGNMLGFFNSAGLLEIAINQENASKLLGLKLMDNIRIEFKW
jgi:hypothetical protein